VDKLEDKIERSENKREEECEILNERIEHLRYQTLIWACYMKNHTSSVEFEDEVYTYDNKINEWVMEPSDDYIYADSS
jgi:hypothetical protein